MDLTKFNEQVRDRASRAGSLKKTLLDPFRTDDGKFFIPQTRAQQKQKNAIMESAVQDSIFEMAGESAPMIAATWSRALQGWEMRHGRLPQDELLASAHKAAENALLLAGGKVNPGGVFEGVEMSTTDGIIMRDRLVSLILPIYLTMITSSMVTFIPGDFNQSEFFRIKRQAGSTFGDLTKGDVIDYNYQGIYSAMDQIVELGTGDGSTTTFSFDSNTTYSAVYPLKPKRTRVWVDKEEVGMDNGSGSLLGQKTIGGTSYTLTGTVTYAEGKVNVTLSSAPPAGTEILLGFDVDIEKEPTLIPRLDHFMESRVLFPHEGAVNGGATLQALWALRRELGQDLDSMTMQTLRNVLAADKDKKHLRDMNRFCNQEVEWERTKAEGISLREHYETVQQALLEVDNIIMEGNGIAGLSGLVAGPKACNVFRYLPEPFFRPAQGYRYIAQPHYCGTLWGMYDLFCDPYAENEWSCLCYGRGPNHGQTAYVAGDAVPPMSFRHPMMGDLVQRASMWELAYRDMQPFDGNKYLCRLTFVE